MYQKLRSIHLSTALFSMAFLMAYGVSAVEFAHRKWLPRHERSAVETLKLAPGIADARVLARQWRGELVSIENSPSVLKFLILTPLGRSYSVAYSIPTGATTVNTTTDSVWVTLAFLHHSHGVWALAAALVSLALLTLGITGLYLWFKNHSSRSIGIVLLVVGFAATLGLILSIRIG